MRANRHASSSTELEFSLQAPSPNMKPVPAGLPTYHTANTNGIKNNYEFGIYIITKFDC